MLRVGFSLSEIRARLRGQTEPKRRFSQIFADFLQVRLFLESKASGKRGFWQETADFLRSAGH